MDWLFIAMLACKFLVLVLDNRFGLDIYYYPGGTKVRNVQILTGSSGEPWYNSPEPWTKRGDKPMEIDETVHGCIVSLSSQLGESVWRVSLGGQLCGFTICTNSMC